MDFFSVLFWTIQRSRFEKPMSFDNFPIVSWHDALFDALTFDENDSQKQNKVGNRKVEVLKVVIRKKLQITQMKKKFDAFLLWNGQIIQETTHTQFLREEINHFFTKAKNVFFVEKGLKQ